MTSLIRILSIQVNSFFLRLPILAYLEFRMQLCTPSALHAVVGEQRLVEGGRRLGEGHDVKELDGVAGVPLGRRRRG